MEKDDCGVTKLTITKQLYLKVFNTTAYKTADAEKNIENANNLTAMMAQLNETKLYIEQTYSKDDVVSNISYNTEVSIEFIGDKSDNGKGIYINLFSTGKVGKITQYGHANIGNTQNQTIKVALTDDDGWRSSMDVNRTMTHELGHSGGLRHPWDQQNDVSDIKFDEKSYVVGADPARDDRIRDNIMNSGVNPIKDLKHTQLNEGNGVTTGQLEKMPDTIQNTQPKR